MMGAYTDWKKKSSLKMLPSYYYHVAKALPDETPQYIHYGMRDESEVHSLDDLKALMDELKRRINLGEVLYIHCNDGTTRTKFLAAGLLGWLYSEMSVEEAVERTDEYCEIRNRGMTEFFPPRVNYSNLVGQKEEVDELLSLRPTPTLCSEAWEEENTEESSNGKERPNGLAPPFGDTSPDVESQNKEIKSRTEKLIAEELKDSSNSLRSVGTQVQKEEVLSKVQGPFCTKSLREELKVEGSTEIKSQDEILASTGDFQEKEPYSAEQLSSRSKLPMIEKLRNEESKDDSSMSIKSLNGSS